MERRHFESRSPLVLRTLDFPASNFITSQTLSWTLAQPGLLADLDNGHYFSAG